MKSLLKLEMKNHLGEGFTAYGADVREEDATPFEALRDRQEEAAVIWEEHNRDGNKLVSVSVIIIN